MRHRIKLLLALTTVALVGILPTAPRAAERAVSSRTPIARHLDAAIGKLQVGPEKNAGYDRDRFHAWETWPNGCDTRARVLKAESRAPVSYSSGCTVRRGRWFSYYEGRTWRLASELDVDHLVPLAEAWGSGARRWNAETLERFGNDLGDPRSLVAVTSSVNRSKGDRDPAEWLPDRARCKYLVQWVAVKTRWHLKVDPAEKAQLRRLASACPNPIIRVVRAPIRLAGGGGSGGGGGGSCHPSYPTVCIPPPPPDLDCGDVSPRDFKVVGSDPHGFDGNDDGVGCETS